MMKFVRYFEKDKTLVLYVSNAFHPQHGKYFSGGINNMELLSSLFKAYKNNEERSLIDYIRRQINNDDEFWTDDIINAKRVGAKEMGVFDTLQYVTPFNYVDKNDINGEKALAEYLANKEPIENDDNVFIDKTRTPFQDTWNASKQRFID